MKKLLIGLCSSLAVAAEASPVEVRAALATPAVEAGRSSRVFLKVGLTGVRKQGARAPLNVALVIDKSSSMAGAKIAEARRAAGLTIDALGSEDFVSVVTYDSVVEVIVPATRVRDKAKIKRAIAEIQPGGMTALFAGVSRGALELREFLSANRVNRVILLSDGMANVGPSSPGELASLGTSLGKEGIAVTTFGLGLGYNEDLMSKLALASDGNHAFIESAVELARFFELEFSDVMSVVAQNVAVEIVLPPGMIPRRVLGRDALIDGQKVTTRLNQLTAGHEKLVMLEVEVPALKLGAKLPLATVSVDYRDVDGNTEAARAEAFVEAVGSAEAARARTDDAVVLAAAELVSNEQNKLALELRDSGKVEEAKQVLKDNASYLRSMRQTRPSPRLQTLEQFNLDNAKNLDDDTSWNKTRKAMRKAQVESDMQQSY